MKFFLTALTALALSAGAAAAQERKIGSYTAMIGPQDLVNSSGKRLTSAGAILAQDRANYHRFGIRQQGDQGDPWFGARGQRAAIPSLVQMPDWAAKRIVTQGAFVFVTVYATPDGQMTRLHVQIPG
ncbi:hypothetical protein KDD17_16780 [Sulfitobacter albidus]|uniref:RcnB family protein n=1 Tax=Sulfitobacter albidus TaxID=2829501 RepID=A0A975PM71_9RHOB|nr:hypothetical protein [Sulfitobacter albidus]QUJ76502.1 hypothetical protein KDD17_16780 [Sulfitobacter albidus]